MEKELNRRIIKKRLLLGIILTGLMSGLFWVRFSRGEMEQDSYMDYAVKLSQGVFDEISYGESRLFPGLPLLLAGLYRVGLGQFESALVLVVGLYLINSWLLIKIGRSSMWWLVLWFPPIVLKQASLVSSEVVLVTGLLTSYWLITKNRYTLAGTVLAMCWWVRAIALMPLLALVVAVMLKQKWKSVPGVLAGVGMVGLGWWSYNIFVLGMADPTWQLKVYRDVGRGALALPQLWRDVWRAIDWGWYRHVVASAGYLAILGWGLKSIWGQRWWVKDLSQVYLAASILLMLAFVFSWGPTPFLEEFPRFLVPVYVYLGLLLLENKRVCWSVFGIGVVVSTVVVLV